MEQRIQELSLKIEQQKVPSIKAERFVKLIKKHKEPKQLTREMVCELVDKIVVYQPEGRKTNRTQQVDIYFNFIGKYDLEYTKEELAEKQIQAEKEAREKAEKQEQRKIDYQKAYYEKKKAKRLAENDSNTYTQKECANCGKMFYPSHPSKKFCSDECHAQATKERLARSSAKRRTADKLENRIC